MSIFEEWMTTCLDERDEINADLLHDNARDYFQSKIATDDVNQMVATDLAQLVSKMERPLSSKSNGQKFRALSYLHGAIDGINEAGFELPLPMVQSMGRFFVEHCRPVLLDQTSLVKPQSDSVLNTVNEKYNSDDVRDASLKCISSLLKCTMVPFEDGKKDKVICARISIMQDAIRGRCASIEDDEDDDEIYDDEFDNDDGMDQYGNSQQMKMLSGLSLLPRAKRSLCFSTLESTLSGISNDIEYETKGNTKLDLKTVEKLIFFTNFATVCLHGESDPRCLIQMLNILKDIQLVLLPACFHKETMITNDNKLKFPFLAIFDAVAPYYPIKFTPPKNDPWRITREGLQNALMNVFTCYIHDDNAAIDLSLYGNENLTTLGIQLILERLSPPSLYADEDDNADITTLDRIEALEDLAKLLVIPEKNDSSVNWKKMRNIKQRKVFESLSFEIVKELRVILLRCHEDSAIAVASSSKKEEEDENKVLANLCRTVVNNFAYELELHSLLRIDEPSDRYENNRGMFKSLWSCFASDQITDLCNLMSSSPQTVKGRVAIAYAASLSACGGEQTLRLCLTKCIPIFLELLKNVEGSNVDEEQIAIAAYGIGVFFSSSRVSMEKILEQNLAVHPHPLQEFTPKAIQSLTKIIVKDELGNKSKSAAIKAFESLLLSSPHFLFKGTYIGTVRHIIQHVGQCMMKSSDAEDDDESLVCQLTYAQFIGTIVGMSTKEEGSVQKQDDTFLVRDTEVQAFVQKILLPDVLNSSTNVSTRKEVHRIDWKILAFTCQVGDIYVSGVVLSHLFGALHEVIQSKDSDRISITSKVISYLFQKGGLNPIKAVKDKGLHFDLIKNLTSQMPSQGDNDIETSTLMLPEVRNEIRSEADHAMELAGVVLPALLAAYQNGTQTDVKILMTRVSALLPPLSEMDQMRLSVILPILSTLLFEDISLEEDAFIPNITNLIEYFLTKGNRNIARIAASSCTFAIIAKHLKHGDIVKGKVMKEIIVPFLRNSLDRNGDSSSSEGLLEVQDAINAMALLGSACNNCVLDLSEIVDEVAKLLASIACDGLLHSQFFGMCDSSDLKGLSSGFDVISTYAANGLGSILSVESAPGLNPFWKQRILHKVYPFIHATTYSTHFDHGRLLCACHLVCSIPLSVFGEKRLSELTCMIIDGLKYITEHIEGKQNMDDTENNQELKAILLCSILKIISFSPKVLNGSFRSIVPVTLLILISTEGDNKEVPSTLMALQIIANISQIKFINQHSACKLYKDVILSTVAKLLDHPSFQVRRAAARVRNTWFVL